TSAIPSWACGSSSRAGTVARNPRLRAPASADGRSTFRDPPGGSAEPSHQYSILRITTSDMLLYDSGSSIMAHGQRKPSRAGAPQPAPADVLGVLRALDRAAVRCVLIGELAEVLHCSPLLPVTGTVTIVPRAGQREQLHAAITAAAGKPIASSATPAIDAPAT